MSGALLEALVAHAGGARRWERLDALELRLRVGGLAFAMVGHARTVAELDALVAVHEQRTELVSRSRPGWRARCEGETTLLLDDAGRPVAARSSAVRARRVPWPARRWDDLQAATFSGYAIRHYATFPMLLRRPGVVVRELGEHVVDGERLLGLAVRFPPDVPAHSREQVLWLTPAGALRRNDYRAAMVGPLAHAANRCLHETTAFGITIPDRRRVTPQLPARRSAPGPVLVSIELELRGVRERQPSA